MTQKPKRLLRFLSRKKGHVSHNSCKYAFRLMYTFPKTIRGGCAMELPKNIVQIGKPDRLHKIFVEDYVVSYIKQLGRASCGEAVGLALYGRSYEENGCSFYFLYSAAKVEGLEHRGPYLSQMEKEEVEKIGRQHFPEYDFLAWCSVKEELADSIYVLKQGKGVEVGGYACFYEKNESMLNYMLMLARQEKREESTDDAAGNGKPARGEWKAETYRKPAPEREEKPETAKSGGKKRVVAAAALFALCLLGVSTLSDPVKMEELQVTARQVIASLSEQKLPDTLSKETEASGISGGSAGLGETTGSNPGNGEAAAVSEDPNQLAVNGAGEGAGQSAANGMGEESGQPAANGAGEGTEQPVTDGAGEENAQPTAGSAGEVTPQPTDQPASNDNPVTSAPVVYTIVKGDTLISICRAKYGSIDKIQEICELNQISDPDSIAVGQTILLPQ